MAFETLLVEDRESWVRLTLNRPDALNSISATMMRELGAALDAIEGRERLCALAIGGSGRAFCAGVDLKGARERSGSDDARADHSAFLDELRRLLLRLEAFPAPVIAAVNGLALAGGLELVLACDLVLAAESARLGDAHANYGLVPGGGSSVRLPRRIGLNRATYLILSGDFLPAATLADWGLVHRVVPDAGLDAAVDELVGHLAARSPLGLRHMKRMLRENAGLPLEQALRNELAINAEHGRSADRAEGLAAFAEKRTPRFTGR